MAKQLITHACGHDETHQLYGPHKDRDRKAAWLAGTDCSDCYYLAKDAAREAQNKESAKAAGLKGLPSLTGSEKQIAWAETIRVSAIAAFEEGEAKILERLAQDPDEELSAFSGAAQLEITDALALLGTELLGRTEARWWIDHRDERYRYFDLLEEIQERGLAPLMLAEVAAHKEAAKVKKAEKRAAYAAKIARASEVGKSIPVNTSTVSVDGQTITVRDGQMELRYHPYIWTAKDSLGDCGSQDDLGQTRRDEIFGVAVRVVADSLAGVSVVAANATKKRSENLTVILSDGREFGGHHTNACTDLFGLFDWTLPADHPEVIRLVAEVRKVVTRG